MREKRLCLGIPGKGEAQIGAQFVEQVSDRGELPEPHLGVVAAAVADSAAAVLVVDRGRDVAGRVGASAAGRQASPTVFVRARRGWACRSSAPATQGDCVVLGVVCGRAQSFLMCRRIRGERR